MRKSGLGVIPLLFVVVIVVSGCAIASRAAPPVSDALRRDAEAYADAQGVSLDEAIRRLRQQDPIGELNAVLRERESDVFGSLWIQHQPEHKVIVLCFAGAAMILLGVTTFVGRNLASAARHYDYGARRLW
jgi:uncharacterized iron-regulated membrane protein